MQLRRLEVKNFRGIHSLEWNIKGSMICLVGKGDSGKSTILQAIWYVLFPSWNLAIYDTDFYNQESENNIEILVTIGDLTADIKQDSELGSQLRGWNENLGLCDEPEDDDEQVLTLRLTVDKTLEPVWEAITDRNPSVKVSQTTRANLGASLLGDYLDKELSWSKGSSLSRLTGGLDGSEQVITDAVRQMRTAVSNVNNTGWNDICEEIKISAKGFGVNNVDNLQPGVDTRVAGTTTILRLFDGNVPVTLYGLGSKRLFLMSLQHANINKNSILLADEIESGLEPHRLRHLIRKIRPQSNETDTVNGEGQVIFTTHSEIPIVECMAGELKVVKNVDAEVRVLDIPNTLQNFVRSKPEAFLGRKVIVCEGDTEYGICRALDQYWESTGKYPFSYNGVVAVSSEGRSQVGSTAKNFKQLGYEVAIFADSDKELDVSDTDLINEGIKIVRWADKKSTEERIFLDIPKADIQKLIDLVLTFDDMTSDKLKNQLSTQLPNNPTLDTTNVDDWISLSNITEQQIRSAIAKASTVGKGWFKSISKGESLGNKIFNSFVLLPVCDLKTKLELLGTWSDE